MEEEGNKERAESANDEGGRGGVARASEVRCVGDCPNSGSHQRVMVASGSSHHPKEQNTTGRRSHSQLTRETWQLQCGSQASRCDRTTPYRDWCFSSNCAAESSFCLTPSHSGPTGCYQRSQ